MKRWFYVDIDETSHLRVAVKANDGEEAKQCVDDLLDRGSIEMCCAVDSPYGRETRSITLADPEPSRPPKCMMRFDGMRRIYRCTKIADKIEKGLDDWFKR